MYKRQQVNTGSPKLPFIAKLNASGALDASIGAVVLSSPTLPQDLEIKSIDRTTYNQYILAGTGTNIVSGNKDFYVLLLDEHGQLVTTFGNDGIQNIDFGNTNDYASHILVRDNGTVIVTGYSAQTPRDAFALVALDEQYGFMLSEFGNNGKLLISPSTTGNDRALKTTIQDPDKLLIVGYSQLPTRDVVATANILANTGVPVTAYDYDGKRLIYVAGKNDRGLDAVVGHDGSIYITGTSQQYNNTYSPFFLKLLESGANDNTFGTLGVVTVNSSVAGPSDVGALCLQNFTQPLLSTVTAQPQNRLLLARIKSPAPNLAEFSYQLLGDSCDALLKFTPVRTDGTHDWYFGEARYETETSTLPSPEHKFWIGGYYKVRHTYTEPNLKKHVLSYIVFVDRAPNVRTNQYYVMPEGYGATVLGVTENKYTDRKTGTYDYEWHFPGSLGTEGEGWVSFDQPAGFYPVSFKATRTTLLENHCPSAINYDTVIITQLSQYTSQEDVYAAYNMVTNGDFSVSEPCPSTSFVSNFPQKCNLNGEYESEKIAVVNQLYEFGTRIEDQTPIGNITQDGNYLFVSEKDYIYDQFRFFGRYDKIHQRDIWSQNVYVEAGQSYLFTVSATNITYVYGNNYTFPVVTLAVNDLPLYSTQVNGEYQSVPATYTATTTGWVKLRVIKSSGAIISDGSLAIDNIIFGPLVNSVPEGRKASADGVSQLENITVSPNPATEFITVSCADAMDSPVGGSISIVNLYGNNIETQIPIENKVTSLSVQHLNAGMYLVKVLDKEGNTLTNQKLIVK